MNINVLAHVVLLTLYIMQKCRQINEIITDHELYNYAEHEGAGQETKV